MKRKIFFCYVKKKNNKTCREVKKANLKKHQITFLLFLSILFMTSTSLAFGPSSTPLYNGIDVSQWQGNIDYSHQGKLSIATSNTKEIYNKSVELLEEMYKRRVYKISWT